MARLTDEIPETSLLAGVPRDDWPEILGLGNRVQLMTGAAVFLQDEPAHDLVVLLSGSVRVSVRARSGEFLLAQLGPGAVLGDMGFLLGGTRSASVRTNEPSTLLRFPNASFRQMLERRTPTGLQVLLNIASSLAARLLTADSRLRELSLQPQPPVAAKPDSQRQRGYFVQQIESEGRLSRVGTR